jgi:hypothetical protein
MLHVGNLHMGTYREVEAVLERHRVLFSIAVLFGVGIVFSIMAFCGAGPFLSPAVAVGWFLGTPILVMLGDLVRRSFRQRNITKRRQ